MLMENVEESNHVFFGEIMDAFNQFFKINLSEFNRKYVKKFDYFHSQTEANTNERLKNYGSPVNIKLISKLKWEIL